MSVDRWDESEDARLTAAQLSAEGVVAVALTWVDNAGITRAKGVPVRRLAEAVAYGVGMSPVFDVFLSDDSATTSRWIGGPGGDLRLFPDLTRAVPLAAQPGWAWAPADRVLQDGQNYPGCQRLFLKRMVERALARGMTFRAAFEIEWIVQRADGGGYPTQGPAYGMHRVTDLSDYLRDLLQALEAQGLEVQQLHPEYSPGQFEVSVAAEDPLAAADTSVLVRHTVRGVSDRHGLRASFAPAFEAGGVGNGGHLHLSAWRGQENLFSGGPGRHGLSKEGEAFLAGVLAEMPALLALGAPSPASALRLVPSHWAGAYSCWGLENREASLRLVEGLPRVANAEFKSFDLSANPYLVLGGVIAAGLAGADSGGALPEEVEGDPAHLAEPPARLPASLAETLEAFSGSALLAEALGEPLYEAVRAVRRAEALQWADSAPEALIAATRWRY